nr:peptidoglycan editing factor PgeF [Bacillus piscicola]
MTDRLLQIETNPFQSRFHVTAGITVRTGGVGAPPYDTLNMAFYAGDKAEAVRENRRRVATDTGFALSDWTVAEQVHGSRIIKVGTEHRGHGAYSDADSVGKADGLYTEEANVLLASFFADCVPLYFFAPDQGFIGLVHAGWKGTAQNIGGTFIRTWEKEEKISPETIYAVIGPAISQLNYEVDNHVIAKMKAVLPNENEKPWRPVGNNRFHLDLKEMNRQLLAAEGLPVNQIVVSGHCTYDEEDLFFSYRREHGRTGRMLAFIGRKSQQEEKNRRKST